MFKYKVLGHLCKSTAANQSSSARSKPLFLPTARLISSRNKIQDKSMSESTYFKLDLIETITGDFADERMVGSGGFGVVYRGTYDGQDIAVKKLHPLQGLDDKAFDNEFRRLSKINHPNVVRLIGYCHESHRKFLPHKGEVIAATVMERVLCFEYMEGGSLDKHILADSCDLDWLTCYKIIKGTCEGLNRLHSEQGKPIYHMDLKPANILLDKNMTAKIGDLGLSRLVSSTKTYQTKAREGTVGYMPPEYINNGDVSRKFDVFSLGVVIIRIMDGNDGNSRRFHMPREQFIEFVANNWKERLQGTLGYSSQEINMLRVKTCIYIALRCVDTEKNKRPYIKDIVNELEELEAKIQKMTLSSDHSKAVILGQQIGHSPILQDLRIEELEKKAAAMARQIEDLQNLVVAMSGQIEDLQKKVDAKP